MQENFTTGGDTTGGFTAGDPGVASTTGATAPGTDGGLLGGTTGLTESTTAPPPSSGPPADSNNLWLYGAIAAAVLGLAFLVWGFVAMSKRR